MPLTMFTRKNRITGSRISLVKNAGPKRMHSWTVRCETHGNHWSGRDWTRSEAEAEIVNPDAWCDDCAASLDWEAQGWQDSAYVAPTR